MKKIVVLLGIFTFAMTGQSLLAQKYAYVDMEYILSNIPSYKAAQNKLDELSKEWQEEIELKKNKIEELFKEYQSEKVLLNEEMKQQREEEIISKEKQLNQLQKDYFGKDGKLYQKRKELVKPIQEEVYRALEELADKNNYAVIFDTSAGLNMVYTDPSYDVSDNLLKLLGYKN